MSLSFLNLMDIFCLLNLEYPVELSSTQQTTLIDLEKVLVEYEYQNETIHLAHYCQASPSQERYNRKQQLSQAH